MPLMSKNLTAEITKEEKLKNLKSFKNRKDIEIVDIEVNTADYPDFCDSYIIAANWQDESGNWHECTDEEVVELNEDTGLVYEACLAVVF